MCASDVTLDRLTPRNGCFARHSSVCCSAGTHALPQLKRSCCAHVRWIVRADPEAGLEMFTEMSPALAPEAVLPILTAEVPQLCAPYLEAALQVGGHIWSAPNRGAHTDHTFPWRRF